MQTPQDFMDRLVDATDDELIAFALKQKIADYLITFYLDQPADFRKKRVKELTPLWVRMVLDKREAREARER